MLALLMREEDYAYARPSLTSAKLRRLELLAGAPHRQGQRGVITKPYRLQDVRDRERELAVQAERTYQRLVGDWQQTNRKTLEAHHASRCEQQDSRTVAMEALPRPAPAS